MPVLRNICSLAICPLQGGQAEISPIASAALVWDQDTVVWVGQERDLPKRYQGLESLDAHAKIVVPGLIDCHTHLGFGGWRAAEFVQRIRGDSYLDIARAGGGILSTVAATRAVPAQQLTEKCRGFLQEIAALGVTTVECKSGYGLDLDTEIKLLECYEKVAREQPLRIVPTFLGAHVVPPEFRGNRKEYVDFIVERVLPEVADRKLALFCDVFVEETAFTIEEARTILKAGQKLGLDSKIHADQISRGGGAELAAEVGAVSADHLEFASPTGIASMAERQVVAVALPLASLYLGQPPLAARSFIEAGVPVALATDFNPGSAPSFHLPLTMTLGCTSLGMSPAEVLKATTIIAARAIGMEHRLGSLEPGKAADFALIDAPSLEHWLYHFRANSCIASWVGGVKVSRDSIDARTP